MVHHVQMTQEIKKLDPTKPFKEDQVEDKALLMRICLHASDLSNPLSKKFELAKKWP